MERQLRRVHRRKALEAFTGLKPTALDNLIASGEFPKPIPLSDGGRAVAWLEDDLIAWQDGRIAARNSQKVA
jgi:prophage regulatory protein